MRGLIGKGGALGGRAETLQAWPGAIWEGFLKEVSISQASLIMVVATSAHTCSTIDLISAFHLLMSSQVSVFKNSLCFPPANGKLLAPAQIQGGWQNTPDGNKTQLFHLVRRSGGVAACSRLGARSLPSLCLQEDV